jgi:isoleucyl-tRNA synthetase
VHLDLRELSLQQLLTTYKGALAELFNVSQVVLAGDRVTSEPQTINLDVTTIPVKGTKCERCWRYTEDVGNNASYPTVCLRCAEALDAIHFPPYTLTEGQA